MGSRSRCIIFDIGGVLEVTPATGWERGWEQRLGLPAGAVNQRLAHVWRAGSVGAISEQEVSTQVSVVLGLDVTLTGKFMADLWAEYLGSPNRELIVHLRDLRPRCTLGILSNSFVGARERVEERYHFGELVDQIIYSHEIGVSKPDRRTFEMTCTRLGVRAEDCLFLDDVAGNVQAARAVGMQGLLFQDNAQAMARIADHLSAT